MVKHSFSPSTARVEVLYSIDNPITTEHYVHSV